MEKEHEDSLDQLFNKANSNYEKLKELDPGSDEFIKLYYQNKAILTRLKRRVMNL